MDECRQDSKIALQGVKMPSAANVKIDKQISSAENALADTGSTVITPLRQAITIIEHKIRNLEKRKVSYKPMMIAIYPAIPKNISHVRPFFLSILICFFLSRTSIFIYIILSTIYFYFCILVFNCSCCVG